MKKDNFINVYDITNKKYIKKANLYVLSNDSYLSRWADSKNKINVCVVPANNDEEAKKIIDYIETRKEQKRIRIAKKIYVKSHHYYSCLENWRLKAKLEILDNYLNWRINEN